jgi:hypothetical protein
VLLKARDGVRLAAVLREHIRGKKALIVASYGSSTVERAADQGTGGDAASR